ncbi:MAG TPA: thiopurine S-methyltransferase [Rhodobacteraceae bacterium]|jgi:thiopurine S-methyltransferase|nr:thiopurine S-methyltransferase [Hellea sp.]HAB37249.1 thiopurine S-methyltransferase [Paracoccaceae bacterium]HAU83680.1 thiopurine S-methyltransferase [Betaproteobacteria bacterium]MDA8888575.1 thiopurine S-methyltransferase [Hellea sp.]MDB4844985.1 thiopurine S-methyltransferase [Hellea sp.]MDC0650642.1 thiopurine S-methyltransferase [Hellea sp.]
MDSEFWHQRWQRKEIGFHKEDPNIYLTEHWHTLNIPNNSLVFVPLCGKSQDMLWLVAQRHKVLGVELSEIAVREFFEGAKIHPKITKNGELVQYDSPNITIYSGDLFTLKADHFKQVQAVYDRGALVALPEKMRQAYIAHLRNNLPQAINGLLVTMEYNQNLTPGPPFSLAPTEIQKLFEGFDDVSDIATDDIEFRGNTVRMRIWKYSRY